MATDRSYKFARGRNVGFRRPRLKADCLGQMVEEMLCAFTSPAGVAVASGSSVVSPAISQAATAANGREQLKIETKAPSKSCNQSGSKSETTKPNCYACKYRRGLDFSAHSECVHPKIGGPDRVLTPLLLMAAKSSGAQKRLNVYGSAHGIRSGWFMWPLNFDPVWLLSCDGFESKDES